MKRLFSAFVLILLSSALLPLRSNVFAYVAGGKGTVSFSPTATTFQTGTPTNVNITFNTANILISGVQVVATFSVSNTDLQAVSLTPNSALSSDGWTFAVHTISTSNGTTTISLMALNDSASGYKINADTTLATISFTANSAFSNKVVTLSQAQTQMDQKSDASDIVGKLNNGTYSATGASVSPTVTSTLTPTPIPGNTATPTNTPIPSSGNTTPTCNSLSANITSAVGTPQTITFTCSGRDPDGYINGAKFTFGDGATQSVTQNVGSPGSLSLSHTYNTIGSLGASCVVEDNNGAWSPSTNSCYTIITIQPQTSSGNTTVNVSPTPTTSSYSTYQTSNPLDTQETSLTSGTTDVTPSTFETPNPVTPTPKASSSTGNFNRIWWILGGIAAVILAILLLRRRKPPTSNPPHSVGTPSQAPPPTPTPTAQPTPPLQTDAPPQPGETVHLET